MLGRRPVNEPAEEAQRTAVLIERLRFSEVFR
jgi:hypothetical protein